MVLGQQLSLGGTGPTKRVSCEIRDPRVTRVMGLTPRTTRTQGMEKGRAKGLGTFSARAYRESHKCGVCDCGVTPLGMGGSDLPL